MHDDRWLRPADCADVSVSRLGRANKFEMVVMALQCRRRRLKEDGVPPPGTIRLKFGRNDYLRLIVRNEFCLHARQIGNAFGAIGRGATRYQQEKCRKPNLSHGDTRTFRTPSLTLSERRSSNQQRWKAAIPTESTQPCVRAEQQATPLRRSRDCSKTSTLSPSSRRQI